MAVLGRKTVLHMEKALRDAASEPEIDVNGRMKAGLGKWQRGESRTWTPNR